MEITPDGGGGVRSRSYLREPSLWCSIWAMEVQEEHVGMKLVEVVVQVQWSYLPKGSNVIINSGVTIQLRWTAAKHTNNSYITNGNTWATMVEVLVLLPVVVVSLSGSNQFLN